VALALEGGATTGEGSDESLRYSFSVASAHKIVHSTARPRYKVTDRDIGRIDYSRIGDLGPNSDAELGFLAPSAVVPDAPNAILEMANPLKECPLHGHAPSEDVPDVLLNLGEASIATTNDPVKLGWPPEGPFGLPVGLNGGPRYQDVRIGKWRCEVSQPVRGGHGVVIEKRDDRARSAGDASLACARQALGARVTDHCYIGKVPAKTSFQRIIVINADDYF
jgi:hypothetical protein